MKILICGDSFAAPSSKDNVSWHYRLGLDHSVTNYAQAGCSEYKILKQIQKAKIEDYDSIIVSHTSPNRVYIQQHPCYANNEFFKNADLIYLDVLSHLDEDSNNKILNTAKDYFEYIFDKEYYQTIYCLLQEKIQQLTKNIPCLNLLTLFDENIIQMENVINLSKHCQLKPGMIGHYSDSDHLKIYKLITKWLK